MIKVGPVVVVQVSDELQLLGVFTLTVCRHDAAKDFGEKLIPQTRRFTSHQRF